MKLIFLIAIVYLLIEFLNRKPKSTQEKNKLEKAIDKAANTFNKSVKETQEILSTPAGKSIVDVQTLDTVLPFTSAKKDLTELNTTEEEALPVIASDSKVFTSNKESVANQTDLTKALALDQTKLTKNPSMSFNPIFTNEFQGLGEDPAAGLPVHEKNTEDN